MLAITAEEVAEIRARRDEVHAGDLLAAPFAEFPSGNAPTGDFCIRGRCYRCDEQAWLAHFLVWPVPREWPPIRTSNGCYCRPCMLLMGVGADGR